MIVKFEKIQGLWYAIIPEYIEAGGDLADCLMVANADEMLDYLANGGEEINIWVSTEFILEPDLHVVRTCLTDRLEYVEMGPDSEWAYYVADDSCYGFTKVIGLCPVNKWVWGGVHPNEIWIKVKK